MSRFASWLGGQGGYLNPQLKAFTEVDDNGDRGVVAEEDIEKGQQLMLIPLSCCLHMPTQQEQAASQVRYFVNRNIVANHTLPDNAAAGPVQCCSSVSQHSTDTPEPFPVNSVAAAV